VSDMNDAHGDSRAEDGKNPFVPNKAVTECHAFQVGTETNGRRTTLLHHGYSWAGWTMMDGRSTSGRKQGDLLCIVRGAHCEG
jgi:hypothetical protein